MTASEEGRIIDAGAFVRANTRALPVPHVPEITLRVADEATALWQKTEEELGAIGLPPPFWAFAWAGGQGLARYILDHPALVAGRCVIDLASGSGLVAIAAARAGARRVVAVDVDPFAKVAADINAALNGVAVEAVIADLADIDAEGADVILAGDIFYDRDIAAECFERLRQERAAGRLVLVGDPGRVYFPKHGLTLLAEYRVPVTRSLEDSEIKRTTVWSVDAAG